MKKFFVTILAIIYLTISCGATVHLHYCMGKLVDWSLWQAKEEKCSKCGMQKIVDQDNGCCKDEHQQIKFEKDQKVTTTDTKLISLAARDITVFYSIISNSVFPAVIAIQPISHSPPLNGKTAVYIRNCVFRI